jgi:predicted phosphodiesterase
MRVGLLADIHEAVAPLTAALRELEARRADAYVMLGDALESGERIEQTVALLEDLPGGGVWGNHDLGLCGDLPASVGAQFSQATLRYFSNLRPWLEIEGHRFQHIDPHLDPNSFEHLWTFPTAEDRIAGFAQCTHRSVFVGHLHDWQVFTPARQLDWNGESTFQYMPDQRFLTVVHAVTDGWCALLDTEQCTLEPIRLT